MYILLHFAFFLFIIPETNGNCCTFNCSSSSRQGKKLTLNLTEFRNCKYLNVSHSHISQITATTSNLKNITNLDMSYNEIGPIPINFLHDATELVELNLVKNNLESLPAGFLNNSKKLKILHLEKNKLPFLIDTVYHQTLQNLTVDCECNLAKNINQTISNRIPSTNCCMVDIKCQLDSRWYTLNDFIAENCGPGKLLAIYITVPIALLCLILGTVAYFLYQKMMKSTDFETKGSPEKSPAHVQPRYISRNKDSIAQAPDQGGARREYENVMVADPIKNSQIKPYDFLDSTPKKVKHPIDVEDGIYEESDVNEGDQPIYSNTQPTYYSYTEPGAINNEHKEEEDVYIMPDQ